MPRQTPTLTQNSSTAAAPSRGRIVTTLDAAAARFTARLAAQPRTPAPQPLVLRLV